MNEILVGNRGGIAYAHAIRVSAGDTTTNAIYSLPDHTFRYLGTVGLMVVTVNDASEDIPGVTIQVNGQSITATQANGTAIPDVTVGDHLLFFNKTTNSIKFFA